MNILSKFLCKNGKKIRKSCFFHGKTGPHYDKAGFQLRYTTPHVCRMCKVPFCPECFTLFHSIPDFQPFVHALTTQNQIDSIEVQHVFPHHFFATNGLTADGVVIKERPHLKRKRISRQTKRYGDRYSAIATLQEEHRVNVEDDGDR